jgi:DNA-binding transcriptional LysR family regulator
MNLRQIESFRAVMMTGSASHAADLLQVTQSAVSRSVAELERSIGFALFNRISGRLVPTSEAKLFYEHVARSFSGLDAIRSSAAHIRDAGSGTIKLASMAVTSSTVVPRAIQAFRQAYPKVGISLKIMPSADVRDGVANGLFDLGIAAEEIDVTGVDHQVYSVVPAMCGIPPNHKLAAKSVLTPADLDGVDIVVLTPEDRSRQKLMSFFENAGVKPNIVVEAAFCHTVFSLALEGVGVGFANPMAMDGFDKRGLVFRPFKPDIECKTYLIFPPNVRKSTIVKDMVQALFDARNPAYECSSTASSSAA